MILELWNWQKEILLVQHYIGTIWMCEDFELPSTPWSDHQIRKTERDLVAKIKKSKTKLTKATGTSLRLKCFSFILDC